MRRSGATARLIVALAVGAALAGAALPLVTWTIAVLVGVTVGLGLFVLLGWLALWPMDAAETRANARREEFRPVAEEPFVVSVALAGLLGVVVLLVTHSG